MGSNYRGYVCVIGGILIHLTLGTWYTFGNILPYLASYIASKHGGEDEYTKYSSQCVWIYTTMGCAQALSLPIGGKFEHAYGPKLTAFIGCLMMTFGVASTYFTCSSLYLSIITYGLVKGFGVGFAYTTPLVVGMRWFPQYKGTVNGCIIFGFGAAATIFDIVGTQLINPHNISQDATHGFTTHPSVLNNVPRCFLILASIYIAMQVIGCLMLCNPPDFEYTKGHKVPSSAGTDDKDVLLNKSELTVNEICKQDEAEKTEKTLTEREVLKQATFWMLWCTFFMNGMCLNFFSSQWKDFSDDQLGITDDRFLSIIGSVSSIFNGTGRLFWSAWMDRNKSYKLTMGLMTFMAAIFLATWPLLWVLKYIHPVLIKISSTVWLCGLFFTVCGSFSVFPTQITHVYGTKNNGVVYGLLFTSMLPGALFGTFGIIYLRKFFGWYFTAWFFALCAVVSFVLTLRSKK